MAGWTYGDLHEELEQRLDDLLAEFCPDWQPREPFPGDLSFIASQRRSAKRAHLGDVLTERPEVAVAAADFVLGVIACDEDMSCNRQLIDPVVAAAGRRIVQRYLISVIEAGPEHKKVCATYAWYWSQAALVYEGFQAFDARRATPASQAAYDEVTDLRDQYRIACLRAFIASQHTPTRKRLAEGFLLKDERYPPNFHHLVAQARTIAKADPHRYENLLSKEDDEIGLTIVHAGP